MGSPGLARGADPVRQEPDKSHRPDGAEAARTRRAGPIAHSDRLRDGLPPKASHRNADLLLSCDVSAQLDPPEVGHADRSGAVADPGEGGRPAEDVGRFCGQQAVAGEEVLPHVAVGRGG